MNKREIAQILVGFIRKGDFENAKTLLATDFRFNGSVPQS